MRVGKISIALAIFAFALFCAGNASAQTLEERIAALENENAVQQAWIDAMIGWISTQQGYINTQQSHIRALQDKLAYMNVVNGEINGMAGPHVIFTGANVHVRSGSGTTDDGGSLTGLGNLVVGYSEELSVPVLGRGGSHNLILGDRNEYSSYGGLVAGYWNTISGPYGSVSGGFVNTASGSQSCVSGGWGNTAGGNRSSVSGGLGNEANGTASTVSGGYGNTSTQYYSTVSGGYSNAADANYSTVSGGSNRTATGESDWRGGSYFSDW